MIVSDRLAQLVTPICRNESLTEFHAEGTGEEGQSLPSKSLESLFFFFFFLFFRDDFKVGWTITVATYWQPFRDYPNIVFFLNQRICQNWTTLDIAQTVARRIIVYISFEL